MKKLLLFIHGLGGDEKTWGEFPRLIEDDRELKGFDVEIYTYPTSLIRPKNVISFFSKLLAFFTPQSKLPKIQDIAEGLKTELTHRYGEYQEVFLVTHSMGGLVAKKYLIDILKTNSKEMSVKKLLLYAVPNNGADLAQIAKFYPHEQIAQLTKNSDFIEFLNKDSAILNLENYVDTLYAIGTQDQIVDKQSAQMIWANTNLETLHKGHMDIVKPKDKKDISYIVLKKFILGKKNSFEDVSNNPFIDNIAKTLQSKRLLTLFSQDFTDISTQQALVKQKKQYLFKKNFYHLRIPQSLDDEVEYFKLLAKDCGFCDSIKSVHAWSKEVSDRLEDSSNRKICFYITGIEDGNIKLNLEFARAIRSLRDEFSNFYAIFIGRKKLASLVYGKNSKLSPLNTAEWMFFDDTKKTINLTMIRQDLESLKSDGKTICRYLDDEVEISWTLYSEYILNTLFWRNIMLNKNGKYVWRNEVIKQIGKEIFGC